MAQADEIRCTHKIYQHGCTLERNEFMVNNSSRVIALFNGAKGGTKNTLAFAKKNGTEVVIIKPE